MATRQETAPPGHHDDPHHQGPAPDADGWPHDAASAPTAAGETLAGGLSLSATSGTATNSAVASGTEIVGAGVTSFNEQLSATQSITEIDINFNNSAGNYHIFVPNITAAIASKNLYAFATTAVNADVTAGRFTVELEYSVF